MSPMEDEMSDPEAHIPVIRAPRGSELQTKGWSQEGALRMLMNNLDPDVGEKPQELIVYGGTGKAARNWECLPGDRRDPEKARERRDAGRPVGKARRRLPDPRGGAPRPHRQRPHRPEVGDLGRVPASRGAGPDDVRPDDGRKLDLHRHPGHPPGDVRDAGRPSPTSISAARSSGRLVVSAGLGGMGGAQPLAVTMNDGVAIVVEVDRDRIQRRLETRYVDRMAEVLDEALELASEAHGKEGSRCPSPSSGTRPTSCPSSCAAGSRPTS